MRNRILLFFILCGLMASAAAQSSFFDRLTINVGGGPGLGRGYVGNFAGNTYQGTVGAGFNFNKLFSVDAEYMYYDLKLRPSVSNAQGLADATGHLQSVSLDGIVNVPRHIGKWGAYGIFGVGFDDRSVAVAHKYPLQNGTVCPAPYSVWWGITCVDFNPQSPPTVFGPQTLGSFSRIAGSYNFGGGINYRLESWHHARIYLEYRNHKAYQSDGKTIVWPITVGLRW